MTSRYDDPEVQEKIRAAVARAEEVCARCRPKPMTRLDSGPHSENQWETQMRETYPGWGEGE